MRRGRFLLLLALLFAIIAGWRVVTLGLSDHYARANPERALSLRPDHAPALAAQAEQLATAAKWTEAVASARQSITADPLQARSYRVLAGAAQAAGDGERAYALYRIAARHSPRDATARIWLFNHHLTANNTAAAMADLDALLRARPKLAPVLTETIYGMATRPELQAAFVASLQSRPPWRPEVLPWVVREAPDLDGVARLIEQLRLSPSGLEPAIAHDWIERLIRERRFEQAYLHWVAGLAPSARSVIGNIFNGSFELPLSGDGFNWRLEAVAGARSDLLPVAGRKGVALRLAFDDQRVPFNHLSQLLLLPSGHYQLQGEVMLEDLKTQRGLIWGLSCAEDGRAIASSEVLRGSSPWRSFATEFEILSGNCEAQWLRLQLPARIASEQRISGTVWFDGLRVSRSPLSADAAGR